MPKDVIYQQFEGLIVGTDVSCRAQGFMFIFGSMTSTTYNGVLCWYYLCVLQFQLQDEKIKRYIDHAKLHCSVVPLEISQEIAFILSLFEQFHIDPDVNTFIHRNCL